MNIKKIIPAILIVLIAITSKASNADKGNAVTMASFEQGWLDNTSTIALKNNTDSYIHNITFLIEYLDMKGNQLDYKIFSEDIDIAPGMTKKTNLPAYESNRHYSYYESDPMPSQPHKFKVRFTLKSYNNNQDSSIDSLVSDKDDTYQIGNRTSGITYILGGILNLVIIVVVLAIYVGLYVGVAKMAKKRYRSVIAWVLLSLLLSPIICMIILWAIGENRNNNDFPQYLPR